MVGGKVAQKSSQTFMQKFNSYVPWETYPVIAATFVGCVASSAIIWHKWIRHLKYEGDRAWLGHHKNSVLQSNYEDHYPVHQNWSDKKSTGRGRESIFDHESKAANK